MRQRQQKRFKRRWIAPMLRNPMLSSNSVKLKINTLTGLVCPKKK